MNRTFNQNHAACNLATGEIILCSSVNALKCRIRHNEDWDRAHGYYTKSEWVFAHGGNNSAYDKLREKVTSLLAKKGGAR